MKVRLEHSFDSDYRTLTLILDKNDGGVRQVVDQLNYDNLTKEEMEMIGRLQMGLNIAFEKMWH